MKQIYSVSKAYHSTRQKGLKKFENRTTTAKIDTGEGAHVHGWGLYLQSDEIQNREMYYDTFRDDSHYANKTLDMFGKRYECEQTDDVLFLNDFVSLNIYDIYPNPLSEAQALFFQFLLNDYFIRYAEEVMNDLLEDEDAYAYNYYSRDTIEDCKTIRGNTHSVDYKITETEPEVLEDGTHSKYVSQYTVEIPDDMVFIDEDSPVPSIVYVKWYEYLKTLIEYKDKIPDNPDQAWYDEHMNKFDGWRFYQSVASVLGDQEKASLWLSENGIDGMTYEGGRDGGCFVIYNCDKLKIVGEY